MADNRHWTIWLCERWDCGGKALVAGPCPMCEGETEPVAVAPLPSDYWSEAAQPEQGDDGRRESKRSTFTVRLGDDATRVLGHLCGASSPRTVADLARILDMAPTHAAIAISTLAEIGVVDVRDDDNIGVRRWSANDEGRTLYQRAAEREEGR